MVKVGLAGMPSDPDPDVIFSENHLSYPDGRTAIGFDFLDHGREPLRYFFSFLKPSQCVVVFEPERCDASLALIGAELEWHQGKSANPLDQIMLHRGRDDLGMIAK